MNLNKAIIFIVLTTVYTLQLNGQSIVFKEFNYNIDNPYFRLKFSFDIPIDWSMNQEYDGTGYERNCTPTDESEVVEYNDCFDGIIFRIKYLKGNLDSALIEMGIQKKSENIYLTSFEGKIKIIYTTFIYGETYSGLYYTISNEIICKSSKKKKTDGKYQFVYFSDGKQTICIQTNGRKLDENVFQRIVDSFKFM